MPRWLTAAILLTALYSIPPQTFARGFILPGLYYNQDLGWAFTLNGIQEDTSGNRFQANLDIYQSNIGQIKFTCFLPRRRNELSLLVNYQFQDYALYSQQNSSDRTKLADWGRHMREISALCDFPQANGFFFGLQVSYRDFHYDMSQGAPLTDNPFYNQNGYLVEGDEYAGSVRVGLETRDNRFYTRSGAYFLWQMDLGRSKSTTESDPMLRWNADVRGYLPVGRYKTILALNLRGGDLLHHVPYFSRFTLGGQYTLRGYPQDRYIGSAYYLARAEVRQTVIDSLKISIPLARTLIPSLADNGVSAGFVLFTEGGDLWRDDHRWWGFRQTAGAGLRVILLPSIVAAMDVARPLEGGDTAFYLSLDQSF